MVGSIIYRYRIVFVGRDWFIEIQDFPVMDQFELDEMMLTLKNTYGWAIARQVFVGVTDSVQGLATCIGLNTHQAYLRAKRGEWRTDIMVTDWFKGLLE